MAKEVVGATPRACGIDYDDGEIAGAIILERGGKVESVPSGCQRGGIIIYQSGGSGVQPTVVIGTRGVHQINFKMAVSIRNGRRFEGNRTDSRRSVHLASQVYLLGIAVIVEAVFWEITCGACSLTNLQVAAYQTLCGESSCYGIGGADVQTQ